MWNEQWVRFISEHYYFGALKDGNAGGVAPPEVKFSRDFVSEVVGLEVPNNIAVVTVKGAISRKKDGGTTSENKSIGASVKAYCKTMKNKLDAMADLPSKERPFDPQTYKVGVACCYLGLIEPMKLYFKNELQDSRFLQKLRKLFRGKLTLGPPSLHLLTDL